MQHLIFKGVRPRSDHVHTTNEQHQSLFISRQRPPLQTGLCPFFLVHTQNRLLCSHRPKWPAPRGKTNLSLIQLSLTSKTGVKTLITPRSITHRHAEPQENNGYRDTSHNDQPFRPSHSELTGALTSNGYFPHLSESELSHKCTHIQPVYTLQAS